MSGSISDLLGVYALGSVGRTDRRRVERAVERDPALRAQLESYLDVVAALDRLSTDDLPRLDPSVWDRIDDEIRPSESTSRRGGGKWSVESWFSRRSRWLVPAAAAVALVVAVPIIRVVQLDSDNAALRQSLERPLAAAAELAAQSPGASILPLSPASDGSGAATVSVVYQADGTGFLIGDALPELETDRTYQLWAIVDGRVISAGVLGNRPGVSPFQFVGDLDGLVVTEEAMGGVVSSSNPPVALWLAES